MKRFWRYLKNQFKLRKMDEMWYWGGNCFELFPPSFYYTHTPEEAERLTAAEIDKLKAILAEYEQRVKQGA